ncbi:MAG: GPW/gp25 family protein [Bacteroidota bacterium]
MQDPGDFIGTGWQFPPQFGPQGQGVNMVGQQEEIRQSIELMLDTLPGERLLHQDFGSSLRPYLYEPISDTLLNEIKGNIRHALIMYENRVEFSDVVVEQDPKDLGKIMITVEYQVPKANSRYNLVFPYYLAESNNP